MQTKETGQFNIPRMPEKRPSFERALRDLAEARRQHPETQRRTGPATTATSETAAEALARAANTHTIQNTRAVARLA